MKKLTNSWATQQELDTWYQALPGQHLLAPMQQQFNQLLSNVFGYFAVSIGSFPSALDLSHCRISKHFIVTPYLDPKCFCVVDPEELPFAESSVDLFLLPQGFDFVENPQFMLSEISRCLIGEGRVLIMGFNQKSLFGLWKWLQGDDNVNYPWNANLHSFNKIKRLLLEYHFEIEQAQTFYFRPPFSNQHALEKLKFIEVLGPLLWRSYGAMYAILAKKQVSCVTPVSSWPKLFKKNSSLAAAHRVMRQSD